MAHNPNMAIEQLGQPMRLSMPSNVWSHDNDAVMIWVVWCIDVLGCEGRWVVQRWFQRVIFWKWWVIGKYQSNMRIIRSWQSPWLHKRMITPSAWKDQAWTEVMADLWSGIPKCSASCKSSLTCWLNGWATCDNLSHDETWEATTSCEGYPPCSWYLMVLQKSLQTWCKFGF